eukprot:5634783-Prymnesium_polylepis.2
MATQLMESGAANPGHVAAMATVAATMSGAANAVWLRQLEAAFPGTGGREVAAKTLIHAIVIGALGAALEGASLEGVSPDLSTPLLTSCLVPGGGASPHRVLYGGRAPRGPGESVHRLDRRGVCGAHQAGGGHVHPLQHGRVQVCAAARAAAHARDDLGDVQRCRLRRHAGLL